MTLTLSLSEIRNIVIGRYSLPADTLVTIDGMVKITTPEVESLFAAMKPFCLADGTIDPLFKIAAIKKLREFFTGVYPEVPILGLAVSKYAIEDWANLSNKIRTNNRLPRVDNSELCGKLSPSININKTNQMTPLTQNPTVVIRLDSNGQNIISVASNISADLKVILTEGWASFEDEAANKPFSDTRTLQPEQIMSMAGSKARYATK